MLSVPNDMRQVDRAAGVGWDKASGWGWRGDGGASVCLAWGKEQSLSTLNPIGSAE